MTAAGRGRGEPLAAGGTVSSAAASLRLADGRFDCRRWRALALAAARDLDPQAEAICPFGFELTRDPAYLRGSLWRLYVYLRVQPASEEGAGEPLAAFAGGLLARLQTHCQDFAASLHGLVVAGRGVVLRPPPGRVLHLRARPPGPPPLLGDWARYLLATPGAAVRGELAELAAFPRSQAARSYLYQLAILLHHLLGGEGALAAADAAALHARIDYDPTLGADGRPVATEVPAAATDLDLLRRVVEPQLAAAARLLATPAGGRDRAVELQVLDFHGPRTLTARVSRARLAHLGARIATDYAGYGEPSSSACG